MNYYRSVICVLFITVCVTLTQKSSRSLTLETVKSEGHSFGYSIEPNWQGEPIQKHKFNFRFTLFNESKNDHILKSIVFHLPKNLKVDRRNWNDKPIMNPIKNAKIGSHHIEFNYDKRIRGYEKGEPMKAKFIDLRLHSKVDRAVTEPIGINVRWSKIGSSHILNTRLKKRVMINADSLTESVNRPSSRGSKKMSKRIKTNFGDQNKSPLTAVNPEKELRDWFETLMERTDKAEMTLLYNYLSQKPNPAGALKTLLRREVTRFSLN